MRFIRAAVSNRQTRPGPDQPRLSTGRWPRLVWAGKRDGTKPLEIPKKTVSLTVTQQLTGAAAPGEGLEKGRDMSPRPVYPALIWNNLTEPTCSQLPGQIPSPCCSEFCFNQTVNLLLCVSLCLRAARIWDKMYSAANIWLVLQPFFVFFVVVGHNVLLE